MIHVDASGAAAAGDPEIGMKVMLSRTNTSPRDSVPPNGSKATLSTPQSKLSSLGSDPVDSQKLRED